MKKFKSLRSLFSDSSRWTKGAYARTKSGRKCKSSSPNAVKFCLYGGLERVYGSRYGDYQSRLAFATRRLFGTDIVGFNDDKKTNITMVRKVVKEAKV